MAEEASAVRHSLRSHEFQLVESDRTLVRGTDQEAYRRDSFFSVEELVKAVHEFLNAWNEKPRPFIWTATVDSILAKLARCRQTLEQIQPGCTLPKTQKRKTT